MVPVRRAAIALCLAGVAVLVPSATAHPGHTHVCAGIVDAGPTGMDPADVKGLRVRNVSCNRGRRVARHWLSPNEGEVGSDGRKRFGHWVCSDHIGPVNGVQRTKVRCKAHGFQRVRFYLG
jgi:hypothetical protein